MKVGDKIRVVWKIGEKTDGQVDIDVVCTVQQLLPQDCVKATVDDPQHPLHSAQGGPHELWVTPNHYETV